MKKTFVFLLAASLLVAGGLKFSSAASVVIYRVDTLPSCRGSMEVTKSPDSSGVGVQINVVFRNVEQCSKFQILSNDGLPLFQEPTRLQGDQPNFHGSRTISKNLLFTADGAVILNNIRIRIASNAGIDSDCSGRGHCDQYDIPLLLVGQTSTGAPGGAVGGPPAGSTSW